MINDLKNEEIVQEIKELINTIDSSKDEVNIYCALLKQVFLANSSKN